MLAVVGLHEAWVLDGVGGRWGAHAAVGFLHDDGEDEALVDAGGLGDGLDGGLQVCVFGCGVVVDVPLRAGICGDVLVCFPECVEGEPGGLCRPAGGGLAVAEVGVVLHLGREAGSSC